METTTNYNFNKPTAADVVNVNMDYLNDNADLMDQSLKDLDDKITEHETDLSHIPYAVATGSANSYEVTISPVPTTYEDGMAVRVKINDSSTGASTLNVNGLGAKAIVDCYGNLITNDGLKANTPYIMCYESVSQSFIVQGKGGGGNATANQILDGVTATVDGGPITGTMPNNGAVVITPSTVDQAISEGYHNGQGYVEGDSNLKTENIKAGTSIFGVQGKDSVVETSDATATEDKILDGYTSYVNGSKVAGTMPNNGKLDATLDINGTYTIPAGYTDGGKVTQDIPTIEAETYIPGIADQTIASGQYLSGIQTILGDANLVTDNIKAGASIFGVSGKSSVVDTEDATAGAGDILSGKTVYINGAKTTGNMPNNGSVSQSLAINGSYTIPKGYHDGTGKVTQNIPSKSAQTYNPSTSTQTITSGQYLSGNQVIAPVTGNANVNDVVAGKTFSSASGINQVGQATLQSLGGRQYATNTVASSSTSQYFTYTNGSGTNFMRYVVVSGLSFTPSLIVLERVDSGGINKYTTVYNSAIPNSIMIASFNAETNSGTSTYSLALNSPAYVNSTGFCLPTYNGTYTWYAIG